MARRGDRDVRKERFWRRALARWRGSGLGIRAFCAENDLSEALFYAWRRTIAKRDRETVAAPSKPGRRQSGTRRPRESSPTFLPVHVVATSPTSAIEIVLRNGRILRLAADVDPRIVGSLLALLEEAPC